LHSWSIQKRRGLRSRNDRLAGEPEKAVEISKAVEKLREFKTYLERECTRLTFTSAEELAKLVAISLANATPRATARVWTPLFCHALQPAQHLRGRQAKLQELKGWLQSPVTPDRVVSVVAAGGFYEDSHSDAFLHAAHIYFTGERDAPARIDELTDRRQGSTPIPRLIARLNRQLSGWANYFSLGYPRQAHRKINWHVGYRLANHLKHHRSQRRYRLPEGMSYYGHLQRLGLEFLSVRP
jgi:hypothetical protein